MTEKEKKLELILRSRPDSDYDEKMREAVIANALEEAHSHGWTDDFIRICEENPDLELGFLATLLFKGRYKPLEVYDDETGEILGYGYPGNFPDGRG